jgi:Retinal pigment epithelial membrane protein
MAWVLMQVLHMTGVLEWAGRLYALHESGLPYEMRPTDLSTIGESNLNGTIEGNGPFAAHYRIMHQPDDRKRCAAITSSVMLKDAIRRGQRSAGSRHIVIGSRIYMAVSNLACCLQLTYGLLTLEVVGCFVLSCEVVEGSDYVVAIFSPQVGDLRRHSQCPGHCTR